jgi:hypothetical protein
MAKLAWILISFGIVASCGGCMLLADGGWQSYNRNVQSTRWPAVEARVSQCSILGGWRSYGRAAMGYTRGKDSYVRCSFEYDAGGIAHESTINVGSLIFTPKEGRKFPPPRVTEAKMQDWIARHPSGSMLTIHYDPSNPNAISLAGADDELQKVPPYDRLLIGVLLTAGGLALVAAGKIVGRRSVSKSDHAF